MPDRDSSTLPKSGSTVFLVGAGVVGRAILGAHLDARASVCLVDLNENALTEAVSGLNLPRSDWQVSTPYVLGNRLSAVDLIHAQDSDRRPSPIIIESIAERLDVKQSFFADAEHLFGDAAVFCSNTSTLRIGDVAAALQRPERFCGMHFFMPVQQRHAVEIVRGEATSNETVEIVRQHATRIAKTPLVVGDGPGFIVNRLLSPYLNQAMLLLGLGADAEQIERAALAYGMPMSPLELIDLISARTVFDAGRVFWQAFPDRINPSPIAPALLKQKRLGRADGAGFYDYVADVRSKQLSPAAVEIIQRYQRDRVTFSDQDITELLSIPMWIEAALASREGIANSPEQFEKAMIGGLGYDSNKSWLEFFEAMGSPTILESTRRWSSRSESMRLPDWIAELLSKTSPTDVLERAVSFHS